jgi:hypothetical protein
MARPRDRLARLCAALILAAAPQALAQPASPAAPALAGNWAFETDVATFRECVITGEATLTASRAPGRYDIRLTTLERCATGETWRSRQSCTGAQEGRTLRITCAVVHVEPGDYAPDDFVLQAQSADAMQGALVSSWSAPARWRRMQPDLVS